MRDEKLDGFVFGTLVRNTVGRSGQMEIELSALVDRTGLPSQRVRVACRRLESRGFLSLARSTVRLTALGREAVVSRFGGNA
ncbi:MAG: hypothetical protein AAFU77_14395 [Myxococcota bacterium]